MTPDHGELLLSRLPPNAFVTDQSSRNGKKSACSSPSSGRRLNLRSTVPTTVNLNNAPNSHSSDARLSVREGRLQDSSKMAPAHSGKNGASLEDIDVYYSTKANVPSNRHARSFGTQESQPPTSSATSLLELCEAYRDCVVPIDAELLEALKPLTPESLGGTMSRPVSCYKITRAHADYRGETSSNIAKYAETLTRLYDCLIRVCNTANTQHWELPSCGKLLDTEDVWPLYILTLHQWFLSCVMPDADAIKVDQQPVPKTASSILTNAYGARCLWAAMRSSRLFNKSCFSGGEHSDKLDATKPFYSQQQVPAVGTTLNFSDKELSVPAKKADQLEKKSAFLVTCNGVVESSKIATQAAPERYPAKPEPTVTDSSMTPPVPLPTRRAVTRKDTQSVGFAESGAACALTASAARNQHSPELSHQLTPQPLAPPSPSSGRNNFYSWNCRLISFNASGVKPLKARQLTDLMDVTADHALRQIVWRIDPVVLTLALLACGRYDAYVWAMVLHVMRVAIPGCGWAFFIPAVLRTASDTTLPAHCLSDSLCAMVETRASHAVRILNEFLNHPPWGQQKEEYIAHMILTRNKAAIDDTLNDLFSDVWHAAFQLFTPKEYKHMEGTLIAMCGDPDISVRTRALNLLNILYDRHDWQREIPLVPVVKQVADPFVVTVTLTDSADPARGEVPCGIFLILCAPSFNPNSPLEIYSYHEFQWTFSADSSVNASLPQLRYPGGRKGRQWIGRVDFGTFPRCGFYDWRVVRMDPGCGSWEPVQVALNEFQRSQSNSSVSDLRLPWTLTPYEDAAAATAPSVSLGTVYPHPRRTAEMLRVALQQGASTGTRMSSVARTFSLQGRFIVQPCYAGSEQMHQILIDLFGCEVANATGELQQRGSFLSIVDSLLPLRQQGITLLSLDGALARDTGESHFPSHGGVCYDREDASPFAVTCRSSVSDIVGSDAGFTRLLDEAHCVGIKVVCKVLSSVSASRPHRKYERFLLQHMDEQGRRHTGVLLPLAENSLDPLPANYCLNYRDVACWDTLIDELSTLVSAFDLDGFHLSHCDEWPLLFYPDERELSRVDADGLQHYTVTERFKAPVVLLPKGHKTEILLGAAFNIEQNATASGVAATGEVQSDDFDCGFWTARPVCDVWANPFLVNVCKSLWRRHPQLLLIGDCSSKRFSKEQKTCTASRQAALARSGIIPQLSELPIPLAKLFGKLIDPARWTVKNEDTWRPAGSPHHQRDSDVAQAAFQELMMWFDAVHRCLPEGALMIQSSCPASSPLPTLMYGRGSWPAVDILFLMPDIPATADGETRGESYRLTLLSSTPLPKDTSCSSAAETTVPCAGDARARETLVLRLPPCQRLSGVTLCDGLRSGKQDHPASRPSNTFTAVRGLNGYALMARASELEAEHIRCVGPEYGFDLEKINCHYTHRRWLRHHLKVFRLEGIVVPLYATYHGSWFPRVLAFLRFDPTTGEFVLLCVNVSECTLDRVSVSLQPLACQFRNMGLGPDTIFARMNIFDLLRPPCDQTPEAKIPRLGTEWTLSDIFPVPGGQRAQAIEQTGIVSDPSNTSANPIYTVYSLLELLNEPQWVTLHPYQTQCFGFRPLRPEERSHPGMTAELYFSALQRLKATVRSCMTHTVVKHERLPRALERALHYNVVVKSLLASVRSPGLTSFMNVLRHTRRGLENIRLSQSSCLTTSKEQGESELSVDTRQVSLHDLLVDSGLFSTEADTFDAERWKQLCSPEGGGAMTVLAEMDRCSQLAELLLAKMVSVASIAHSDGLDTFAQSFIDANTLGPIVFITSELGKWSTVGGLGVMVDELSRTLAQDLGQSVYVITPYYDCDSKGRPVHLGSDGIEYKRNIQIEAGHERIELGVHEGRVAQVNLIFLHNSRFFPYVYPNWNVPDALRFLAVVAKGSLEILCQKCLIPQLIVTNDWPAGLVAAYAKNPTFFGTTFSGTTFFHIVHNLDTHYEGRIYADRHAVALYGWITELPMDLMVDPTWAQFLFNPSRCALLTSDAWGTVSPSYRNELRRPGGSPLAPLLNRYRTPFGYPNGVPFSTRRAQLDALDVKTHEEAKAWIQKTYFGCSEPDLSIPLFAFIGRITEQKGVHLLVDGAEQLIRRHQYRLHLFVGGRVQWSDSYSAYCGHKLNALRQKYSSCFWADPDEFFRQGAIVNLGADIGLMPSKFEPGGIVQHEFFIAGTPVLAFRTGGLKDTVFEFDGETLTGNGFTFEAYQLGDFLYAMERAYRIFQDPEKYQRLRQNASYSAISCEQTAKAWLSEFCRLRRKLSVNTDRVQELVRHLQKTQSVKHPDTDGSEHSLHMLTAPSNFAVAVKDDSSVVAPNNNALVWSDVDALHVKTVRDQHQKVFRELLSRKTRAQISPVNIPSSAAKIYAIPTRIRYWPRVLLSRPRSVAVSGSFDDWQIRHPMLWDNAVQGFTTTLALKPGKYYYKLVVDGTWTLNPDVAVEPDPASGILNNILLVEH